MLSIFRRQKEIGTYIALGMTRWQVVRFYGGRRRLQHPCTILLGAVYGSAAAVVPVQNGMGYALRQPGHGISIAEKSIRYSGGLILATVLLVVLSATLVSFLPAENCQTQSNRRFKGKIQ